MISSRLQLPEGTVKWHLNKARNELKEGIVIEKISRKAPLSAQTRILFILCEKIRSRRRSAVLYSGKPLSVVSFSGHRLFPRYF